MYCNRTGFSASVTVRETTASIIKREICCNFTLVDDDTKLMTDNILAV